MSQYPQLETTISGLRAAGTTDDKIIQDARQAGWMDADIAAAYAALGVPFPVALRKPISAFPPSSPGSAPSAPVASAAYTAPAAPTFSSSQQFNSQIAPVKKGGRLKAILLTIVVVLVLSGGAAYAYMNGLIPFLQKAPYDEGNLMSGILSKFTQVHSFTHTLSFHLDVEPREADAQPFTIKTADDQQVKEKYDRDYSRSQDVNRILSSLLYSTAGGKSYPASLDKISDGRNYSASEVNYKDPLTEKNYSYAPTQGGKNFALTVTFETKEAVAAVKNTNTYRQKEAGAVDATTISGNNATFTKDSYQYLYGISEKPPQNFFQSLGEGAQYLPSEMNISGSITAAGNISPDAGASEWKVNVDGTGDLGDLTYKVNIDAMKKAEDYFIKINNIPSIFGGVLPEKGKWYVIKPKNDGEAASTDRSDNFIASGLKDAEDKYAAQKLKVTDAMKNAAKFADEEKLFTIKSSPKKETVNGVSLYKYDLDIRKEAIVPFLQKMSDYAAKQDDKDLKEFYADPAMLDYFKSSEFSDVFDYYQKNTSVTVWVDASGFFRGVEYSIRVVPSDEAINMKGKQVVLKLKLGLDDINKHITVDAPKDAQDLQEALDNGPLGAARAQGRAAAIESNLANMRAQAELVYSTSNNSYGAKAFPLGPCKKALGTLFGDDAMYKLISTVTSLSTSTSPMCISTTKNGSVQAWAVSATLPTTPDYSYCVDSQGNSMEILGKLKKAACR